MEELDQELLRERYILAMERIEEIKKEHTVPKELEDYFQRTADFLLQMKELKEEVEEQKLWTVDFDKALAKNQKLYEDILGEHYETSYANPSYAVEKAGREMGQLLSFLYTELRGLIVYLYEGRMEEAVIFLELFIEIYNCLEQEQPSMEELHKILCEFMSDNSEILLEERIVSQLEPSVDFATKIVMESDLSDLRYLFRYGEYISENEIKLAEYLNEMPQEEIDSIASTYTEGYRIGFEVTNKDLSKKRVVNVRYPVGFERVIRKAVQNFKEMGLEPTIYRAAVSSVHKTGTDKVGYFSTSPNRQYEYDHKEDKALYYDRTYVERRLEMMRKVFEAHKKMARYHAGPAVVEVFGESPFAPKEKKEVLKFDEEQQKLRVHDMSESGSLSNEYIPGDERSFTIIAFPLPEIGDKFKEIFSEIVKINTLDYNFYQKVQQKMIDVLSLARYVHVTGRNGNRTDMTVSLQMPKNPEKEAGFENCVADVNIPVGEVFTSPMLKGTNGLLHVKQVYLEGLRYQDLQITLKDGMVTEYGCENFEDEEAGKSYIKENILFHHPTLPLGEFAIGTNTTAYVMARKYQIEDKLPILIAEKTGPHFALGDTCYSHAEDVKVCNQDGKEIIARDNEISILRKTDPSKAYFNCHTDITIPYDELDCVTAIYPDGTQIDLIRNGVFVLEGTEGLNEPLKNTR